MAVRRGLASRGGRGAGVWGGRGEGEGLRLQAPGSERGASPGSEGGPREREVLKCVKQCARTLHTTAILGGFSCEMPGGGARGSDSTSSLEILI